MALLGDIDLYLPRYLSETTRKGLIESLQQFPTNIDRRLYDQGRVDPTWLYQGDGGDDAVFAHVGQQRFWKAPCIVLSNTCDLALENERHREMAICYAPILRLDKFEQFLQCPAQTP